MGWFPFLQISKKRVRNAHGEFLGGLDALAFEVFSVDAERDLLHGLGVVVAGFNLSDTLVDDLLARVANLRLGCGSFRPS